MARKLVALTAILAAAGVASAAFPSLPSFPAIPFLAPPEVVSHELVVEDTRGGRVEGSVVVHVRNPNFFPIRIDDSDLRLRIDRQHVLDAELDGPVTLHPHSTTPLSFEGEVAVRKVERIVQEDEGPVPAEAAGKLRVGWILGGVDIPFRLHHEIDPKALEGFVEACRKDGECARAMG